MPDAPRLCFRKGIARSRSPKGAPLGRILAGDSLMLFCLPRGKPDLDPAPLVRFCASAKVRLAPLAQDDRQ